MIRSTVSEYVNKTLLSSRFILSVVLLYLTMRMMYHGMAPGMKQLGYTMNAFEPLSCFLNNSQGGILVYYLLFVFLISAYPHWDGCLNRIARLGKRKWLLSQYLYVAATAVIYYLVWTAGFIIQLFPVMKWDNSWGNMAQLIVAEEVDYHVLWERFDVGFYIYYSKWLLAAGSPVKVWLLGFMLHVLCCIFIGVLAITLNVCIKRGAGTLVAALITGTQYFLQYAEDLMTPDAIKKIRNKILRKALRKCRKLFLRMQYYISPLFQTDVVLMVRHDARPLGERALIAVTFFCVLIAVISICGMKLIKHVDLSQ